ncbi:GNAT family N-acetyltransferase [Cytobacillus sp. Hm23]
MAMVETKNIIIRNYVDEDADKIAQFNFVLMLSYRYNGDFEPNNIFCAADSKGNIYGVGHLELDQTWFFIDTDNKPANFVYKLNIDISLNPNLKCSHDLKNELLKSLMKRAEELRSKYPSKKIKLTHFIEADELEEINFYLSKGFVSKRTHLVMKRDLTEEIHEYPLQEGIKVINWKMETQEEEEQYLKAEAEGDLEGESWSLNKLRWTKGGSEWDTFTAFCGDKVVGSVMTWGIGEKRSATESIFVLPEWRRIGIAKSLITQALKFLQEKGKNEATLCVLGHNSKAISLYCSLGYKMLYINLEFELDI